MLKTVPQIEVNIKSSEKKIESISPEICWQLFCDKYCGKVEKNRRSGVQYPDDEIITNYSNTREIKSGKQWNMKGGMHA